MDINQLLQAGQLVAPLIGGGQQQPQANTPGVAPTPANTGGIQGQQQSGGGGLGGAITSALPGAIMGGMTGGPVGALVGGGLGLLPKLFGK
jgi:hypothetical protein